MKRTIFLLVIACFLFSKGIDVTYAQYITDGDPFYFCALNSSCYNNTDRLVTSIDTDYSREVALLYTELFMNAHPGFELLAPASLLYNCHGFAYSVYQGGDTLEIGWTENLCSTNGTTIESYIEIPETQVVRGDIATIIDDDSNPLVSRHSSIVWNSDTMISKWNNDPLFKHYKYDSWIANETGLGTASHYVYYRRIINTPNQISGPYTFNGTGVFEFYPSIPLSSCTWNVEPAEMFQNASGSGTTAYLSYATPFVYLAPKATITYTFSYGCANHYTVSKEFDLRIPTSTISGNAVSEGFIIDANATVTVTGNIKCNKNAKTIVPVGTKLI